MAQLVPDISGPLSNLLGGIQAGAALQDKRRASQNIQGEIDIIKNPFESYFGTCDSFLSFNFHISMDLITTRILKESPNALIFTIFRLDQINNFAGNSQRIIHKLLNSPIIHASFNHDTIALSVTLRQFVPSEKAGTDPPVSSLTKI